LFLPEKNVLGITSVLLKSGTQYSTIPNPQDFITIGPERWFEVDALVQDRVFVEDPTKTSDQPGIKVGLYITTSNKFISEYTPQSFCKLTFGGGNISADEQLKEFARDGKGFDLSRYTNNYAMGAALSPNTTLFVQYRIGGGLSSNVGINTINQIGTVSFAVNGPSASANVSVTNSLQCNNVTAAIGGANPPTTEDVRNMVSFNFSAQNRAVTVNDYNSILRTMPAQFGAPAKVAITEENNKIRIKMLSYDSSGVLTNVVSNTLKQNVANYLSNFRMINDYISIEAAETIDLAVTVDVVLDNSQNQGAIIAKTIEIVTDFFNPLVRNLGQNVNISELKRLIQSENGIVSVSDVLFFNQVGGQYSSTQTSMTYLDPVTRQIQPVADTLFATPTQIYQVRYPNKDINIRVLNLKSVNFS
jgi:hypothetical protein